MPLKTYSTIVAMPDSSHLEVDYYIDAKQNEKERKNQMQLLIQLYDCICTLKIEKSICKDANCLERIVHNKVINTKEHLC